MFNTKLNKINDYSKINDLSYFINLILKNEKNIHKSKYNKPITAIMSILFNRYRSSKNNQIKKTLIYLTPNAYSKSATTENFSKNWLKLRDTNNLTYRTTINIIKILEKYNIIQLKTQGRKLIYAEKVKKHIETFIASEIKLNNPCNWNLPITPLDDLILLFGQIYNIRSKKKLKRKEALYCKKINGKKIYTPASKKEIKDIKSINKIYSKKYSMYSYTRIFGKNKHEYGRLYGLFQQFPKELRSIIIEHHNLVELDYEAMICNILYIKETGKKYKGDVYLSILNNIPILKNLPELHKDYRKLIKTIMISVLNNSSEQNTIKSIRQTLVKEHLYSKENTKYYKSKILFNPYDILKAIKLTHFEIKDYFCNINSDYTQLIESNIIKKLLVVAKKNSHQIFSIHDAIIVESKNIEYYNKLKEELLFKEINKFNLKSKIKKLKVKDTILKYKLNKDSKFKLNYSNKLYIKILLYLKLFKLKIETLIYSSYYNIYNNKVRRRIIFE